MASSGPEEILASYETWRPGYVSQGFLRKMTTGFLVVNLLIGWGKFFVRYRVVRS